MPDSPRLDLIAAVKRYVGQGGQLMLVFDAGTLTSTGFYPIPKSRSARLISWIGPRRWRSSITSTVFRR